jgi:putative FmdB family regulatory protein
MPLYEYECLNCGDIFQSLILSKEEEISLACSKCGSTDHKRLISRTVHHVSESDRLAGYDPSVRQSDSFYRDSRNIGLSAQKRAQQMGVDLGSNFNEKLEKLRTDPSSVLKDGD